MQSTVKKCKADLATAENTVTNLNHKVRGTDVVTYHYKNIIQYVLGLSCEIVNNEAIIINTSFGVCYSHRHVCVLLESDSCWIFFF